MLKHGNLATPPPSFLAVLTNMLLVCLLETAYVLLSCRVLPTHSLEMHSAAALSRLLMEKGQGGQGRKSMRQQWGLCQQVFRGGVESCEPQVFECW